jgi:hypothetical protein
MMPEFDSTIEYKEIPSFPGYADGSDGSIWSSWKRFHRPKKTMVGMGKGSGTYYAITDEWSQLYTRRINNNYVYVVLSKGGKRVSRQVHRLVLEAFVGPCPAGMEACHFPDADKSNNKLDNLRWDTKRANGLDSLIQGRNKAAKLSPESVRSMRSDFQSGIRKSALARKYGVSLQTVKMVFRGKIWSHVL